ncbi:uncharacterized protein TNCV_2673821 [Trichonephila clavipes]|nr:uncharacterized protein TNCV_2673821 [Trichonephila clavipes]
MKATTLQSMVIGIEPRLLTFFIPELNNHDVQELWFQQDGATCHTAHATIYLLKDTFGDRLISRFGPVNWPPRSCDLSPLDYFLTDQNIYSTIVEDRKAREENLRIEEQNEKLRIEEQEENLRIEKQKEKNYALKNEKKIYALKKQKEKLRIEEQEKDYVRTIERLNIDQENRVSHLLGLLPTEVSHIAREPDDKANSYEHVKDLLLKRFKLTPEKFRQLFVTHQKEHERTWIDFYLELNTYFNGWIDGLKIDTFDKLSDLIITDQLKRKTPFDFKEYYLDEWANMNSPVQLAEKLEEFKTLKGL